MKTHRQRIVGAALAFGVGLLFSSTARAAIDISWYTIDGGGITFATDGGSIEVGATVGQPDPGEMSDGGSLTISGGFWFSISQPTLNVPPDVSITCGDSIDPSNTGLATGSDDCTGSPVITYSDASAGSHPTIITRTWTFQDACGNSISDDQTITINDIAAPTSVTATPSGVCSGAVVSLSGTVGPGETIDWYDDICEENLVGSGNPLIVHPTSTTIYYARARNTATACVSGGCASVLVSVSSTVSFVVNVALAGVVNPGPFDRCLRFELWNCSISNVAPVYIVNQPVTFTNGQSLGVSFTAPCGMYTCLTARDRLHTLRRTLTPVYSSGQYTASFTGPKALLPGNLNDDRFIDILDFGIYTTQDLTSAPGGADTSCAQTPPFRHADVTGDGQVNSLDFGFISTNFLKVHDPNCCGAPALLTSEENGATAAVTSITVSELQQRGLNDLAAADLNHDGVLNVADVEMYMQSEGMSLDLLNRQARGEAVGE